MQMFKQPVKSISQGDRAGVCVTQLDAKVLKTLTLTPALTLTLNPNPNPNPDPNPNQALERGIACTPGYMHNP